MTYLSIDPSIGEKDDVIRAPRTNGPNDEGGLLPQAQAAWAGLGRAVAEGHLSMTGPGGLDETFGKLSSRHTTASEVALLFAGFPVGHAYRSPELQRRIEGLLDDYHLLKRLRR